MIFWHFVISAVNFFYVHESFNFVYFYQTKIWPEFKTDELLPVFNSFSLPLVDVFIRIFLLLLLLKIDFLLLDQKKNNNKSYFIQSNKQKKKTARPLHENLSQTIFVSFKLIYILKMLIYVTLHMNQVRNKIICHSVAINIFSQWLCHDIKKDPISFIWNLLTFFLGKEKSFFYLFQYFFFHQSFFLYRNLLIKCLNFLYLSNSRVTLPITVEEVSFIWKKKL